MAVNRTVKNVYIFGDPQPMDKYNLPTFGEILEYYYWIIAQSRKPSLYDILSEVCDIWHRHNIPHTHAKTLATRFKSLMKKYVWLKDHSKYLMLSDHKAAYLTKFRSFKVFASEMFDISLCKCNLVDECCCDLKHKVPQDKRVFLLKQRQGRSFGKLNTGRETTAIYYFRCQPDDDLTYEGTVDQNANCNILILADPDAEIIDQIPVRKDKTTDIFLKLVTCLEFHGESMDDVVAMGCDGIGLQVLSSDEDDDYDDLYATGVISLMEKFLNRPLHHFVSMLYINDMLLKFLCQELNVISMVRNVTQMLEPIGRDLQICEYVQLNRFRSIDAAHIPVNINRDIFNGNELYLYRMGLATSTKFWDQDLATRQPNPIQNQNAVTLASRILRLYVSKMQPSKELITMATYVCQVYIPMMVHIRCDNLCQNGSKHSFKLFQYVQNLPRNCAFPNFEDYFKKFAFYLHPENLILSMISDANFNVRKEGYRKILWTRNNNKGINVDAIRVFRMPEINLNPVDYTDLIQWDHTPIFEPPITMKYTDADLQQFMNNPNFVLDIPKCSC